MGPDNFIRRDSVQRQAQPGAGTKRSLQPQRPAQRAMDGFGPVTVKLKQPTTPRPMQNLRAPAPAHPVSTQPKIPVAPGRHNRAAASPSPAQPSAQPQATPKPGTKKTGPTLPKSKKITVVLATVLLLIIGGALFAVHNSGASKVNASSKTALKPLTPPDFTVYYPQPLPDGLSTVKGTVTYSKNSFTYIISQNGKKAFFVYEQPSTTDPGFKSLQTSLTNVKPITLSIGKGVAGTLNTGTITAVTTDKNTNLIINCINTICSTVPEDILSNMQLTTDLNNIRRSTM